MRQALRLHPDSRCAAVTGIDVDATRPRAGGLALSYVVTGKIGDLRLPAVTASARADELWRRTCFEVFVRATGEPYYEFNFAPSSQWAAYRFDRYRSGMCVAGGIAAPRIETPSAAGRYTLLARLELDVPSSLPSDAGWRLGLAAAIEETNGNKSYWALAHPPGRPDFHHADGFAYELSPA